MSYRKFTESKRLRRGGLARLPRAGFSLPNAARRQEVGEDRREGEEAG
jgi:hypothetical protein